MQNSHGKSVDKTDMHSVSNQNPSTTNPDKSRGEDVPDHREHLEPKTREEEE